MDFGHASCSPACSSLFWYFVILDQDLPGGFLSRMPAPFMGRPMQHFGACPALQYLLRPVQEAATPSIQSQSMNALPILLHV